MVYIKNISVLDDTYIHFIFSDGAEKTIDFSPFIGEDFLSKPLSDPIFFRKVALKNNWRGIFWPNEYDFCPDFLRKYQSEKTKTISR